MANNGRRRARLRVRRQAGMNCQENAIKRRRQIANVIAGNRVNPPELPPMKLTRNGTLVPRLDSCAHLEVLVGRTISTKPSRDTITQGFRDDTFKGVRRIPEKDRKNAI